ncbi:MAG: hypothetical protein Cons2KO_30860 [Congregibacter sp.]
MICPLGGHKKGLRHTSGSRIRLDPRLGEDTDSYKRKIFAVRMRKIYEKSRKPTAFYAGPLGF